jgi:hypothetical protein
MAIPLLVVRCLSAVIDRANPTPYDASMKSVARFCLLSILLLGCSNPNESANKLFVEATTLFQDSFAEESSGDPEAAAVSSEKALNGIEKIIHS